MRSHLLGLAMNWLPANGGAHDAQLFTNDKDGLGAALGRDVSHPSANIPELMQEQATTQQQEIHPEMKQEIGFSLSL
jgi:hypothetical protein